MLKSESRIIDGAEYTVQQMPAMMAVRMSARLSSIFAPALAKAAGAAQGKVSSLLEVDISSLAGALETLMARINEDELADITKKLLHVLRRDGIDITKSFDVAMAGQVMTIFKLLHFAFEVNYGDFSGALAAWFKAGAVRKQSVSKELTT